MVNINIELPNELHKELKVAAAVKECTLKEYFIERLEQAVKKAEGKK